MGWKVEKNGSIHFYMIFFIVIRTLCKQFFYVFSFHTLSFVSMKKMHYFSILLDYFFYRQHNGSQPAK